MRPPNILLIEDHVRRTAENPALGCRHAMAWSVVRWLRPTLVAAERAETDLPDRDIAQAGGVGRS